MHVCSLHKLSKASFSLTHDARITDGKVTKTDNHGQKMFVKQLQSPWNQSGGWG